MDITEPKVNASDSPPEEIIHDDGVFTVRIGPSAPTPAS